MQSLRNLRYTIGHFMLAIAVVAVLLAATIVSPDRVRKDGVTLVLASIILGYGYALSLVFLGHRCPACSRWTLKKRRGKPGHTEYYRCSACRARFKRRASGPWLDASGPDDAARFARRTAGGIWEGFSPPEKASGSRSGLLLQCKRSRDVIEEVRRYPTHPGSEHGRRDAERKVRKFLKDRNQIEE